jgi:acetylornithine deacetylase/succinyl-diaminopimelate desuccinylase-like protein
VSPLIAKGPILAIATAASALLESRSLDVDLVMLIEGEEEAGSDGFRDAVRENKVRFISLALASFDPKSLSSTASFD